MIFAAIDDGALAERLAGRLRRAVVPAPDIEGIEAELAALAEDHGAERITRGEWLKARAGLARRLDEAKVALAVASTSTPQLEQRRRQPPGPVADPGPSNGSAPSSLPCSIGIVIHPAKRLGLPPMVEGIGRIDLDRVDIQWRA